MNLKDRIFGANSLHIPNIRDEAGINALSGINEYKQRMAVPLSKQDHIVLPKETKQFNQDLLELYANYNIPTISEENILYLEYPETESLSQAVISQIAELRSKLNKTALNKLSPFMFSQQTDQISKLLNIDLSTSNKASEIVNNKFLSQKELGQLGVSVPEGKLVHSLQEAENYIKYLRTKGYKKVSFKLQRAASGMGVFEISLDELNHYAQKYQTELEQEGILIDGWIENKVSSPNI